MNKCQFCGKESGLFTLKLKHCEDEYGPGIENKVCGNCWDAIFEIALLAIASVRVKRIYIDEPKTDQQGLYINALISAVLQAADWPELVYQSFDGRGYVFMCDINKLARTILQADNLDISPQSCGKMLRNYLGLEMGNRQGKGVPVFVDQEILNKLRSLKCTGDPKTLR